ncbi:MAG: helix-hairpin-helix domain-containing protein [Lachnospiraceae bacterium]|nr:helix-hairpin-helix domain-containing protein [Lachnospiraceae bacterium]
MKKRIYLFICITILCAGCAEEPLQYVETGNGITESGENWEMQNNEGRYETITVHICGEVYFPGVYTVYSDSRIYEVVQQAGGFTEYADKEAINQAKEVSDGEQIYIPSVFETEEKNHTVGLVDINKANEAVLCTIPGIGATRARQIIEFREKNGNFKKIEDIMKISGIKEGMFEKIAPYITVS